MILSTEYSRVRLGRHIKAWGTDGDFITPEGKVIHVGENHKLFMMSHPGMFGDSEDPDDMVYQGWVQTRGIGGRFSINADGGMNRKQLSVLQKMVENHCKYSDPNIEVLMNDGHVYELTCDDFRWIEYPNEIKRGIRSL